MLRLADDGDYYSKRSLALFIVRRLFLREIKKEACGNFRVQVVLSLAGIPSRTAADSNFNN